MTGPGGRLGVPIGTFPARPGEPGRRGGELALGALLSFLPVSKAGIGLLGGKVLAFLEGLPGVSGTGFGSPS